MSSSFNPMVPSGGPMLNSGYISNQQQIVQQQWNQQLTQQDYHSMYQQTSQQNNTQRIMQQQQMPVSFELFKKKLHFRKFNKNIFCINKII